MEWINVICVTIVAVVACFTLRQTARGNGKDGE